MTQSQHGVRVWAPQSKNCCPPIGRQDPKFRPNQVLEARIWRRIVNLNPPFLRFRSGFVRGKCSVLGGGWRWRRWYSMCTMWPIVHRTRPTTPSSRSTSSSRMGLDWVGSSTVLFRFFFLFNFLGGISTVNCFVFGGLPDVQSWSDVAEMGFYLECCMCLWFAAYFS